MSKQQSPSLRFNGFSGVWEENKLGDIADIVRGASPRPIQDPKWFDDNSDIGWLRISDVTTQNGRIRYLEQKISKIAQEKTRVLEESHLLLSIAASVGKPVINYVKTGVHDGFLIFRNPTFELEFMFQYLDSFVESWRYYGQPGTQINLNSDIVKNSNFSIPTLPEQTQIGNFFRHLDQLIAESHAILEKSRQLKKAMLAKMFPAHGETMPKIRFKGFSGEWEREQLKDVVNVFDNLRIPVSENERVSGNTPYFGANGIQDYVDGFTHDGEFVLIAEDGANDLQNYPVQYFNGKGWVNNHAHVLQGKADILNNLFLFARFQSMNISRFLVGGGRAKLNGSVMLEIEIEFPIDKQEQTQIGNFFRQLDETIALQQAELEKLSQLKQGLLATMLV